MEPRDGASFFLVVVEDVEEVNGQLGSHLLYIYVEWHLYDIKWLIN